MASDIRDDDMIDSRGQPPEQADESPPAEAEAPSQPEAAKPPRRRRFVQPLVLVAALALGGLLRLYVYESDIVQGSSMQPGLHSGDYLLISKISYRAERPRRFDIVTFPSPFSHGEVLVKRIVGLPGEWIMVWDGRVYANGRELKESFVGGGDHSYDAPVWVPPGYVYVMGDNRDNSEDSREFGPVPISSIRGKAVATFFPLNRAKLLVWRGDHEKT